MVYTFIRVVGYLSCYHGRYFACRYLLYSVLFSPLVIYSLLGSSVYLSLEIPGGAKHILCDGDIE
jgi:hypothetical protein